MIVAAAAAAAISLACHSPGVVDGDTLRCDGQRLRLWGIQAPERGMPGASAAARRLAELTTGKDLACRTPPTGQIRDRYGRPVVQCFVGRRDLAEDLVAAGLVADWPRYSGGYYAGR